MVAISLYRGKLHRSPDVPRQWLTPTPKISLKDFKNLLQRRSRALSRLQATSTTSNPNPNLNSVEDANSGPAEGTSEANGDKKVDDELAKSNCAEKEVNDQKVSKVGDEREFFMIPGDDLAAIDDAKAVENSSDAVDETDDSLQHLLEPLKTNTLSDIEKRKKEVEEKLQILNAKKHNLVQVLKQILSAEEELRRRSNVQGSTTGVPPISLKVDVGNDNGSSLPRSTTLSPSSDNLHKRAHFSTTPRTTSGVAASSPSRFAPNAASPSPSGGNLSVRDATRLPSPWN